MTLEVTQTVQETRERISGIRKAGKSIALVPTMGALHRGHSSLIETARRECEFVVVSIFVNPLQFGPNEDYARYPSTLSADLELCRDRSADLVFAPTLEGMYPEKQLTYVEVTKLSDLLCGYFRRGHFRGVATVVLKLLNIVQPDRAYFGEKDFQQLALIRRMIRDLDLPVDIRGVPTVRDEDGLAMSSRNQYLDSAERAAAPVIHRALLMAREMARSGETDANIVKAAARELIEREPLAEVQYFELVNKNLEPVPTISEGTYAACAIFFGTTRLIDNVRCL